MAKTIYNKIKSGKIPVIKKELEDGVVAEANREGYDLAVVQNERTRPQQLVARRIAECAAAAARSLSRKKLKDVL